ncbi:hypothetical protein H5410_061871, partial [Solanum commersonii]
IKAHSILLGLPITQEKRFLRSYDILKLSVNHFLPLIEKITAKITCWSAKLLSYAGRVQLIIFLTPKKVMKSIEQNCRTFLCTGNVTISKKALVSWENFANLLQLGPEHYKFINKECLWIQWVHNYFIRRKVIETIQIPKNASWVVRKILEAREWILQGQTTQGDLSSAFDETQSVSGKLSRTSTNSSRYLSPPTTSARYQVHTEQRTVISSCRGSSSMCRSLSVGKSFQFRPAAERRYLRPTPTFYPPGVGTSGCTFQPLSSALISGSVSILQHRNSDREVYRVSEDSQEEEDQYNLCSGDQMGGF